MKGEDLRDTSIPDPSDGRLSSPVPLIRGVLAAVAGAFVGALLFRFALSQSFYVLALPGAAIGMACGFASRRRSPLLAIFCGVLAAGLGIYLQWTHFSQAPLPEFLSQIHQIGTVPLAMLTLGTVFGAWFGYGR